MKRSGFARPPLRPARQMVDYTPRPRAVAVAAAGPDRAVVAVPKTELVRDESYRRLVASLPCVVCGVFGFSQCAHRDEGKGMASKQDDRESYPACCTRPGELGCHHRIGTAREFPKAVRRELELLWCAGTRAKLRKLAETDASARVIVQRVIGL